MTRRRYTDPGGSAYFDGPRRTKSLKQSPESGEMSASDFSLKNALHDIRTDMTTQYLTEKQRQEKTAHIIVPGFTAGFAEKIASLTHDEQVDLLGQLFGTGLLKASSILGADNMGQPPPKPIPQTAAKQQFNLGSQMNMMGKQMPIGPDGKRMEMPTANQMGTQNMRNPLTDQLPKYQMNMSLPQQKSSVG